MNTLKIMTGISVAAALCGCTTPPTPPPPAPVLATPEKAVSIKATISESAAPLNVKVDAKGATARAKTIAEKIKTDLESDMASDGFLFMDGETDVVLSFAVTESQSDKSGDYLVWAAAVPLLEIKLKPSANKLIGKTSVATMRGDRVLGENAAVDSVAVKLASQVVKWTKKTLVSERIGLKAVTLRIQCTNGTKEADDAYIKSIRDEILAMQGVYYCNITKAGDANRFWDVRVVYDGVYFATGFTSRLMEDYGVKYRMEKVCR